MTQRRKPFRYGIKKDDRESHRRKPETERINKTRGDDKASAAHHEQSDSAGPGDQTMTFGSPRIALVQFPIHETVEGHRSRPREDHRGHDQSKNPQLR